MSEQAKSRRKWKQSRWRGNRAQQQCYARPKCWEESKAEREAYRAKKGGGANENEPKTPYKGGIGVCASHGGPFQTDERDPRGCGGGGAASDRERDRERDASGGLEIQDGKCKDCWAPCCHQGGSCCAKDQGRDCCWESSTGGYEQRNAMHQGRMREADGAC